jgi:NitT/TauT family transport system substrate-binding protein
MSKRYRSAALVAVLGTVLLIAACGSSSNSTSNSAGSASSAGAPVSGSGLATMTVAFTPTSDGMAFKIADQQGFFKQHGIAIKYGVAAPTGAEQIAQILNGQITMGQGAYTGAIAAVSHGLPIVITNAMDQDYHKGDQSGFGTIVAKNSGITSFKDLEGKTVAVNSLEGNWQVSLEQAVAKDGGDPSKVKLVVIPFADQVTALKTGRVDAISTLQPFVAQLTSGGYRNLGDAQAIGFGGQQNSVVNVTFMSKKFTQEHPEVVKNFVAALQEADSWANAHPSATRQTIENVTKTPATVVNATPIPDYTTHLGTDQTNEWSQLLVKYGILKQAPPASDVQWSGAPL